MRKHLSIIVPVRNENEFLRPFYYDLLKHIGSINYELVWVNNASTDSTFEDIQELMQQDSSIRCITLRNEATVKGAVLSAMNYAKGDYFIIMKGDLQHPASLIPHILEELENQAEIVCMKPNNRANASRLKRWLCDKIYKLSPESDKELLTDMSEFKGLRRGIAEDILFTYKNHLFIEEFFKWHEYNTTVLEYENRKCAEHMQRYSNTNLQYTLKLIRDKTSPGKLKKFALSGNIAASMGMTSLVVFIFLNQFHFTSVPPLYFVLAVVLSILGIQLSIMSNFQRKLKRDLYQCSTSNQYQIEHIHDYQQQLESTSINTSNSKLRIRKAS